MSGIYSRDRRQPGWKGWLDPESGVLKAVTRRKGLPRGAWGAAESVWAGKWHDQRCALHGRLCVTCSSFLSDSPSLQVDVCLRRGQTPSHHSRETTCQAALSEGLTPSLPLPPAARGEPSGLRVPHRCSRGLRGRWRKIGFCFWPWLCRSGIWGYGYLARNHRNKNNLMKPRESELLRGRRPNAIGCTEPHPKGSLRLGAAAQLCRRGTGCRGLPRPRRPRLLHSRTQSSLEVPQGGKCGSRSFS